MGVAYGGADGGDEGAEFVGVFLAGGEFDAGDDVDAAGIEEVDGVSDVGGGEASGDDDGEGLLDAFDDGEGGVPVESPAGASAGSGRTGVEEDAVDGFGVAQVVVERTGGGEQFAGFERLDDLAETEGAAEFGELVGRFVAVELNSGHADLIGKFGKALRGFVDDHAELFDGGRQGGDDCGGGFGRDLARASGQDEAEGAGSDSEAGESVVEVGVGTDLNPDHEDSFRFQVSSFKLKRRARYKDEVRWGRSRVCRVRRGGRRRGGG